MLETARKVGSALNYMLFGAVALAYYLRYSGKYASPELHEFARWGLLVCIFAWHLLRDSSGSKKPLKEPTPSYSVRAVILATGLTAALISARDFVTLQDLIPTGLILLFTVVAAIVMGRFADRHRDEIGAATFPQKPEG